MMHYLIDPPKTRPALLAHIADLEAHRDVIANVDAALHSAREMLDMLDGWPDDPPTAGGTPAVPASLAAP